MANSRQYQQLLASSVLRQLLLRGMSPARPWVMPQDLALKGSQQLLVLLRWQEGVAT